MNSLLVAAIVALSPVASPVQMPPHEVVTFKTADGVTIEGDYYFPLKLARLAGKPARQQPPGESDKAADQARPADASGAAGEDHKHGGDVGKPAGGKPPADKAAADKAAPDKSSPYKAPVAILIHMYPADRSSWAPIIPRLHEAGFAVLAYDIRGKGGSSGGADSKLARLYADREPALFAEAWKDAEAAKKFLAARAECDTGRTVCIGASIGCSISIQYGSMDKDVRAVVCLSPGTNYFGVDSASHVKKLAGRDVLLIAPEGEYKAVIDLIKASGDKAIGGMYPGGRERHGTNLFAADYYRSADVIDAILDYVKKAVSK